MTDSQNTEPTRFKGSLHILQEVNKTVNLPLLMKDIVTNDIQVEAASRIGADSILLIATLFKRNVCEGTIEEMIKGEIAIYINVLFSLYIYTS